MFEAAEKARKWADHFEHPTPQQITGCQYATAVESGNCAHMTKVHCERIAGERTVVTLAHCQQCVLKKGT